MVQDAVARGTVVQDVMVFGSVTLVPSQKLQCFKGLYLTYSLLPSTANCSHDMVLCNAGPLCTNEDH